MRLNMIFLEEGILAKAVFAKLFFLNICFTSTNP